MMYSLKLPNCEHMFVPSFTTLTFRTGESHLYHRAHFLEIFINRVPKGQALVGKRLVSYSQSETGPIELSFTDGTTATCDVMIGCDGIKSAVRGHMYKKMVDAGKPEMEQHIAPYFTGELNYRCMVPVEMVGKGSMAKGSKACGDKGLVYYRGEVAIVRLAR